MRPHPVGQRMMRAGLVAALGRHVENAVGAEKRFTAAAEAREGVEDLAVLVLVEDAVAREVRYAGIDLPEIVEGLLVGKLLGREGDIEIVVEGTVEGRH